MKYFIAVLLILHLAACQKRAYIAEEVEGYVEVEAEAFTDQSADSIRKWYVIDKNFGETDMRDVDEAHFTTASGEAYLEILPDTRSNHDEKLIHNENFANTPGTMAILSYPIKFNEPGKYYVWVSAYSTGTEDNGIHVGINGSWPESGQRMQWCEGKNHWTWDSKQRTAEIHCGVEKLIYLNIPTPGIHTITFSMREDGFEFDQWAMTKVYQKPD